MSGWHVDARIAVQPMSIVTVAVAHRDADSGTAGHILGLGAALRALGHRVEHLFLEDLMLPLARLHPRLSLLIEAPVAIASGSLAKLRLMGGCDVVEVWDPGGALVAALRRLGIARLKDTAVVINRSAGAIGRVWQEHQRFGDIYPSSWRTPLWHPLYVAHERFACRFADAVVAYSSADIAFLRNTYGVHKDRIIKGPPPGVSPENFGDPTTPRASDILFVGSWIPRKGISTLVASLRRLGQQSKLSVTLAGVGIGNASSAHAELGRLPGLQLSIIERVPRTELFELYKTHRVLLFPSLSEGFGMVVLEAMAAGMAVVCSDIPGAAELIEDGVNGLVVPPRDPETLAARCFGVLQDDTLRVRLGQRAVETARGYTWDRVAAEMVEVYRRVTVGGGRPLTR